ncbi:hypothetical protein [Kaistella yonginensis]|uniref:hypothetical protein n=1 Tax=Kaistella yonginensis TaxID=658267 RepID=UPI0025B46C72|nr:hypothetical protein [Kaistella yonginensis]MDN3606433.1 hypothetical protein [Kaistella yonginensis]
MTNIFIKKIYELTEKTIVDINESNKANFEKADQIIIWIVGFSIGIFVLILPNGKIDSLKDIYGTTYHTLNFALYVIIFGLLYRIFSFITNILNSMILNDLASFSRGFSANIDEIPVPRNLTGNETTIQIAEYLKEDFNYIIPYEVKQEDPKMKELLINYYNILANSNDIDKQLSEFKMQIGKYLGVNKSYIDFFTKEKTIIYRGKMYFFLSILTSILFITTVLIFIIGTFKLLIELNNFC